MNIQLLKIIRDILNARGRILLMSAAIAASIFSFGFVLSNYSIISRETHKSYMSGNPAAVTFELDKEIDDTLISTVVSQTGVEFVEKSKIVFARVLIGDDQWRPISLFVVNDFNSISINSLIYKSGEFPPSTGTMLVEQSAIEMINNNVNKNITIKTPNGTRTKLFVSGIVHDTTLAPAWQGRTAYGFITRDTLKLLGEAGILNELKVTFNDKSLNEKNIESLSSIIIAQIKNAGFIVKEIRIPPPGKHPHENASQALLVLLLMFSVMTLVLSSVLIGSMMNSLMAKEIRQIGIMKTIGATTNQLLILYSAIVFIISIVSFLIAVIPSALAGKVFAQVMASMLNLRIDNMSIPHWVFLTQCAVGIFIPLFIAHFPVIRNSKTTVYKALNDYGVTLENEQKRSKSIWNKLSFINQTLVYSIRNSLRKKGRLIVNLVLLSVAGAMFLSGLNVEKSWNTNLDKSFNAMKYDLEIRLSTPYKASELISLVNSVPGVVITEAWGYSEAGYKEYNGIEMIHTYPDGDHGSFSLRGIPDNSSLVTFPLMKGRLLNTADGDSVMLNQLAFPLYPDTKIGDTITFSVHGIIYSKKLVGIVRETASPAAVYVTNALFNILIGTENSTTALKIALNTKDPALRGKIIATIERTLENNGINVTLLFSGSELKTAMAEHMAVLIYLLLGLSMIMAFVGVLGLSAAMGTTVVERTREFGILKSIGA
ncbi:MAG: hypothetical protein A2015_12250, partial [Spirochaetes bacterium GWF1_31_7]